MVSALMGLAKPSAKFLSGRKEIQEKCQKCWHYPKVHISD